MIFIMRHGQTAMNNAHVMQGHSNFTLNETGIEQAGRTGKWFREQGICFDRVYSSPLARAVQTALLVSGVPEDKVMSLVQAEQTSETTPPEITLAEELSDFVLLDKRLIEMDYGPYEGSNLLDLPPELKAFFTDFQNNPAPDGMEPLDQVIKRAGDFLEEIKELAEEQNILLATHAIAMKGFLEYLTPQSHGAYWSKYIGNCAVYTSKPENGVYSVPEELVYLS